MLLFLLYKKRKLKLFYFIFVSQKVLLVLISIFKRSSVTAQGSLGKTWPENPLNRSSRYKTNI